MLFDFHAKQNRKKPGSLYATYLVTGRQIQHKASQTNGGPSQEGEDAHMQSSPFPSSSMPAQEDGEDEPTWTRLVTLVKEEDLDGMLENSQAGTTWINWLTTTSRCQSTAR